LSRSIERTNLGFLSPLREEVKDYSIPNLLSQKTNGLLISEEIIINRLFLKPCPGLTGLSPEECCI
jgi:hypothetical protein